MPRILIADDEWVTRVEIEEMLTDLGYEVVGQAETGAEAIEMVRSLEPDLIVMDVMMPGEMNGIDAARVIKAELGTPIIFITGYGDPEYIEAAKEIAPFGYVMKPFDEKEIHASVEIALSKRELELKLMKAHESLERANLILQEEIASRKKTEKELRESEKLYRDIFEKNKAIKWVLDPSTGKIIDANSAACEFYQYSYEEMTKLYLWDINLLGEAEMKKFLASAESEEQTEFTFKHRKASGEIRTVQVYTGTVESGGKRMLHSIIIDITDRHRAEEALRESESRYRAFFDKGPDGIVVLNPETAQPIEFNDQVCQQLGYSRDEFSQLRLSDIEVKETAEEAQRHIRKVIDEGYDDFETLQRTKQGELRNVHVTAQTIETARGNVYHCIWRDITERKQAEELLRESEEKLRAINDTALDSIFCKDINRQYTFVNPAMIQLLGFAREDLIGKAPEEVFDKENAAIVNEVDARTLNGEKISEMRKLVIAGRPYTFHTIQVPLRNVDGNITGISGIVRDTTHFVQAEEALRDSEERYRSLFTATNDGICIQELIYENDKPIDYRILDVNPRYESITGIKRDDAIGAFGSELYGSGEAPYLNIYTNVFETGSPKFFETYFEPMGKYFLISVFSTGPHKFATVFQDITDRKRTEDALRASEEKYRVVVESTADGIVVLDLERNMITCNKGFSRLFGYSENEIRGKSVRLIHQSDEEFHQFGEMAYGSVERTGSYQGEVYFRKKDGTLFPAESVTSAIEKEGSKTGYVGIIRDISSRKKTEEERLRNEKDLRESQRIAHLGSWRLDLETNEVFWTKELYRMYGFDPTLPPPPYTEHMKLFTPESWLLLSTSIEKTRDTGIPYELELEMVREGGSKGWIWVRGEAVTDSEGKTIGLWGAAQEITERKGMEEALRKSEERLKLSIDASGLSFWEWFPETGNIYFDEKWQKSLGYDPGEKAFDTEWWKTHIHPDSKPAFDKALKDYLDGKNPRYDLEYQIKTKTGEWRWGRAVGECIEFGEHGQPKLFLGTHEDITATKTPEAQSARGEKELKWLFRSMINAFVLFDSVFDENGEFVSYRFVFINEAYERITGVKNEEVQGKTVHEVWPETEPDWIRKYGEVAVTGVPQTFEMYHHPTKKLYYCNVYRPWDNPDRFCVIFDDITERKQIEAELQHAGKMESIGVLAGGVAHDFNNILGIVLGNAELALDDVPEWNPAHDFLKEIRSAALRAKDVVQELLRFSRKSTGQKKPLEMGQLVKESMKTLRSTIPSSVDFSLNIPEHLHYIHADPTQIHQILMNLASNAADAMEERGILKVTLENVVLEKGGSKVNLEPGKYVKLSMKDTGAGIESENLSRIFDPYFTTKEIGKGTGMGLAVIYGIVQQHAGGIQVETEIGKGTTFDLYFPAIDSKPLPEEKSAGGISGGKERILFVDDEDAMVDLNRQRLERLGYEVTGLTDPIEALAFFRSSPNQIDLVITDMTMPRMTGDRLAEEILKIRSDMPIILCTGHSSKISEERAKEIGIKKYIEKPIEMQNLAKSVRDVLDGGSIA